MSARSALECGGLPPLSQAPAQQNLSTNDARLDARRRGSLVHAFLERIDLTGPLDAEGLKKQAERLLAAGALVEADGLSGAAIFKALDLPSIAWFFGQTEPGQAMARRPGAVRRELPFTASRSLYDLDLAAGAAFPDERLIVQGIADAVVDEGETVTVLDYKTDHIRDEAHLAELTARYRPQLTLYAHSLQAIWLVKRLRAALVFLGARRVVWLDETE
jgi:ATP-dependent helicase/nuclease subunit A